MKLRVLDLFSGIGGFSLGLERATAHGEYTGFETVAFCEIEAFPRKVLAKHWPHVPCYEDVRELTGERLRADGITVDVIVGGFPCQDVSLAGLRGGLEAERSGLWSEYHRLICELRPSFAIVENTPGLLSLGMGRALGDLAACGYDAQWDCIPANRVGAPHERDRVWIVAYPNEVGLQERVHVAGACDQTDAGEFSWCAIDRISASPELADADARQRPLGRQAGRMGRLFQPIPWHRAWPIEVEPVLDRGADGIPHRLDRIGALGNAVVPQIPELIGNAILAALNEPAPVTPRQPAASFPVVQMGGAQTDRSLSLAPEDSASQRSPVPYSETCVAPTHEAAPGLQSPGAATFMRGSGASAVSNAGLRSFHGKGL